MQLNTDPCNYSSDSYPFLSKPKIIGYFSVTAERKYVHDFSQLKYVWKNPIGKVHLDLNHNISEAIKRRVIDERLSFLLSYFQEHRNIFDIRDKRKIGLSDTPFVCYRGLLRMISALCYDNNDPYKMSACLYRGVIYMCNIETDQRKQREQNKSEKYKTFCSWGHKFEQYLLTDDPEKAPDTNMPVNESGEFFCVYETQLNEHRLIYRAEMDGIILDEGDTRVSHPSTAPEEVVIEDLRKAKFVELKTSKRIPKHYENIYFSRHKCRTWWLQSFFAGVETILCGYRDEKGIVSELSNFKMFDLPRHSKGFWHPNICMNFCNEFLTYVKKWFAREIEERHTGDVFNVRDLPMIELLFERHPCGKVKSIPIPTDENISVLPQWYIDSFSKT